MTFLFSCNRLIQDEDDNWVHDLHLGTFSLICMRGDKGQHQTVGCAQKRTRNYRLAKPFDQKFSQNANFVTTKTEIEVMHP